MNELEQYAKLAQNYLDELAKVKAHLPKINKSQHVRLRSMINELRKQAPAARAASLAFAEGK